MNELIKIPFGEPQRVALTLPPGLTEIQWKEVGHNLLRCKDSLQFWIGDWINYGEANYGEKYAQAMDIFGVEGQKNYGYEKKTLENFASVSKRVESSLRREKLSFGHHEVVAALESRDQDVWLAKAVMNEWTVAELTKEIRGKQKAKQIDGAGSLVGKFVFETWFGEWERGFKDLQKRAPIVQWDDAVLDTRIEKIKEIEKPLITEKNRREEAKRRELEVAA